MVTPSRRTNPSLEQHLFENGFEYEFFQAVRLLSRMYPRRREVGGTAKPAEEIARFGAELTMSFPASAVHDVERQPGSADPPKVTVAFLALTGTQGVLPLWYTEQLMARRWEKDDTFAAFLDIFNHRLISLFYRAWKKHRPAVLYEQSESGRALPDSFTHCLFDLIGMGTDGLRGRLHLHDESLLLYAGLIAQRPHSAVALRGMLQDYFGVRVEIDQCRGDWYEVDRADQSTLQDSSEHRLGLGAFLGEQVWDQQYRFRLRVGPLPMKRYLEFLPEGAALVRLAELTRFFAGQALAFDVQVILEREEVPVCRLEDEAADAPRLGWIGWLKTEEFETDAADAVFAWVN